MIIKAAQFAEMAHRGQVRKYTNRPYIEHPMRVAGRVSYFAGVTEEIVAAAWLHDVLEDCPDYADQLRDNFPEPVISLVQELTNPSIAYKGQLNRAARKEMDRKHYSKVSKWAKLVKLVDRTDNLEDMGGAGGFLYQYCYESKLLADSIAWWQDCPRLVGLAKNIHFLSHKLCLTIEPT